MEQTKIILLFSLGVTPTLKGTEQTMLIQYEGRWCERVHRGPFLEELKKRSEGFGTCSQFGTCSSNSRWASKARDYGVR